MSLFDIIKTANSNLFRNKTRTILTILAVFIGSFTIILNTAINAGVNDFIDKQMDSIGGEGYLEMMPNAVADTMSSMISGETLTEYNEKKTANEGMIPNITEDQLAKIRAIDGVISVDALGNATVEYIKLEGQTKRYRVAALNVMPRGNLKLDMSAGRAPNAESDNYEAAVSSEYLEKFNLSEQEIIGKKLIVAAPKTLACMTAAKRSDCVEEIEIEIVGVQAPGVMSTGGSRINIAAHQRISQINNIGIPGGAKAYQATANVDPEKVESIKTQLKEIGFTAMTLSDEVTQIRGFFDAILVVFTIFGGIALLAAAIGIINTLFMSVQERTREIGLDKALGMSNGRVFLSFSVEAILLGFWGSVIGTIISIIIGNILNVVAAQTFLSQFPTFTLLIFTPQNIAIITLIIMFIAFLAGTLPARKASRKDPIEALRYE